MTKIFWTDLDDTFDEDDPALNLHPLVSLPRLQQVEKELTDVKTKYQKAVEEYDGLGVRYNKALAAIIILVDDAEFYSEDVRKLTSFSRIKDLAAELGEKE